MVFDHIGRIIIMGRRCCVTICNGNYDSTHRSSSRPEVFCKKGVLRNAAKFTGKHLRLSLFFNKA